MSKLDEYKNAEVEHERMCDILRQCKPEIGASSQHSSAHHIEFRFRDSTGHLEYSRYLASMLGKVCGAKLDELIGAAERFSEADLAEKARAAQAEAIETLQTIKIEKGETHAPEKTDHQ